jgi:hypothetical protein
MQAIGSLAIPVLRCSFDIISWHQEEIQKLDRKTRKMLTIHGQHHPRADINRLFFSIKDGGRGLMQIGAYIVEVIKLEEYVEHTQASLMQIVRTHQHTNTTHSAQFQTSTKFNNISFE